MKFFDIGQEAEGVIAIGQVATGVIAIGQLATGVIAIGQAARGVVAIGMAAIGVFSLGMMSVGLIYSVGLLGAGGRGFGIILPLVPALGRRFKMPSEVSHEALVEGEKEEGWIRVELRAGADQTIDFFGPEGPIDLKLDARKRPDVYRYVNKGPRQVLVHVARQGERLVCDQVMEIPVPFHRRPRLWAWRTAQVLLLAATAVTVWFVVGRPLLVELFGRDGILRY